MTDRELLELAARAAALDLEWCEPWACMARNLGVIDGFDRHTCWDSLTDDGDALRLAVALGLRVYAPEDGDDIAVVRDYSGLHVQEIGNDHNKITRRAITRAAAQIQLDKEKQ